MYKHITKPDYNKKNYWVQIVAVVIAGITLLFGSGLLSQIGSDMKEGTEPNNTGITIYAEGSTGANIAISDGGDANINTTQKETSDQGGKTGYIKLSEYHGKIYTINGTTYSYSGSVSLPDPASGSIRTYHQYYAG